jgi:PIN domain nuclease of toxin-antitoxin system
VKRFLLDTHVLIHWAIDPRRIRDTTRIGIGDGRSIVFVSAASAWELSIKLMSGKLNAPSDVGKLLRDNRFSELPVSIAHGQAINELPLHHRDPFDRMLIAQALCERLILITNDSEIQKYEVPVLVA